MKPVNIYNVPYLIGLDDNPLRSLPITFEIESETIKDGIDSVVLELPIEEAITPEQKIIYRGRKYVITEIEEVKSTKKVLVTAESLFIELNTTINEFQIESATLLDAVNIALRGTKWTVGTIEVDVNDGIYSMAEEGVTVLYILRRLGELGSVNVEFDTVNRTVNYRVQQQKNNLDVIFRYQKNIKEITKTTIFPKVTRLMPVGRGGLTIASVNNGSDYIEDFSWYESLGMTTQEAKEHYTKTMIWKDERYIYSGNLMRDGQRKLSQLAHPQISYDVELSYLDIDLQVGDYAYIIDEELGIKVKVEAVKLNRYKDPTQDKVELNYLVPALHDDVGGSDVGQTDESSVDVAYAILNNDVTIEAGRYTEAIHIALTTYAPTNLQLGIYIVGESNSDSTLDGYVSMGGNKIGMPIRHKLNNGWNTISLMMVLTQIQEGADIISLYLNIDQGTFILSKDESELILIGRNMLGGASAKLPRADVVEMVDFIDPINIGENAVTHVENPDTHNIIDVVEFSEPINVSDIPSILIEGVGYDTEPPAMPIGVVATTGYNSINLEWEHNTETALAGYNVYVDDIKYNNHVIEDNSINISALQNGETYNIKLTAITVWSVESQPFEIVVEIQEQTSIYFPLPNGVLDYDNWIIVNHIDGTILYAVNGGVKTNIRGYNIGSTEVGWTSWWWTDEEWVFRSDSSTLYLGTNDVGQDGFILTSHDIKNDTTEEVVFGGYQGEVTFE